jgi:hypothetical protein
LQSTNQSIKDILKLNLNFSQTKHPKQKKRGCVVCFQIISASITSPSLK